MSEICALSNAVLAPGFCAYTLPVDVSTPRTVLSVGTSDLLALDRGTNSVVFLFDSDEDGIPDSKRTLTTAVGLNHGLALYDGFIYASSDTTVYRWPHEEDFSSVGDGGIVIENINADGQGGAPQGHRTRTLAFDEMGRLYISVGSKSNVDIDSYRARIRRFDLNNGALPQDFQTGEVFADGLRNEVGLAFDKHGVLWGVENGADTLFRSDMGGDIHQDNPAEELNRFREEDAGKHWGYPYCWTEFKLPETIGEGPGTAWAWPSFLDGGVVTDDQCREDYIPPVISMQGHSAPLGITFYEWRDELPADCGNLSFPETMDGYAFIAFHGSWNRDVPTGYKVVYAPFDTNGDAIGGLVDLLAHEPPNARWEDGFRPVDVDFDDCGRLIVSSDGSGGRGSKILRIQYNADVEPLEAPSTAPSSEAVEPLEAPSTAPSSEAVEPLEAPSTAPSSEASTECPCLPTNSPIPSSAAQSCNRSRSSWMTAAVFALVYTLLVNYS